MSGAQSPTPNTFAATKTPLTGKMGTGYALRSNVRGQARCAQAR
jgi:hypothetical protein